MFLAVFTESVDSLGSEGSVGSEGSAAAGAELRGQDMKLIVTYRTLNCGNKDGSWGQGTRSKNNNNKQTKGSLSPEPAAVHRLPVLMHRNTIVSLFLTGKCSFVYSRTPCKQMYLFTRGKQSRAAPFPQTASNI